MDLITFSFIEMAFQFDTFTEKINPFFEFFPECVYNNIKKQPNRLKGSRHFILKVKYQAVIRKTIRKKQHKPVVNGLSNYRYERIREILG